MNKRYCVPEIPESEQTPTVKMLLLLLEQFAQRIHEQDEEIARFKDEINRLKGQQPRPKFKKNLQSGLQNKEKAQSESNKKRPGSQKKAKTQALTIHEEVCIPPSIYTDPARYPFKRLSGLCRAGVADTGP